MAFVRADKYKLDEEMGSSQELSVEGKRQSCRIPVEKEQYLLLYQPEVGVQTGTALHPAAEVHMDIP